MGLELDMADPRPSLISFVVIGLTAMVFILGAKWAFGRWHVAGLSELVAAV